MRRAPPGSGPHCDSVAMVRRDSLSGALPIPWEAVGRWSPVSPGSRGQRNTRARAAACFSEAARSGVPPRAAAIRPVSIARAARGSTPGKVSGGGGGSDPRGRDRSLHTAAPVPQTRRAREPQLARSAHHAASPPHRNAPHDGFVVARRPVDRRCSGRGRTRLSATRGTARPTEAGPALDPSAARASASLRARTRRDRTYASRRAEILRNAAAARRLLMRRWIAAIAYREPRIALRPARLSAQPWIRLTDTVVRASARSGRAECRSRVLVMVPSRSAISNPVH